MKPTELRDLDDGALLEQVRTFRRDQFGLRLQHATGELENTSRLRTVKRDLARALTVARERGLDASPKTAPKSTT